MSSSHTESSTDSSGGLRQQPVTEPKPRRLLLRPPTLRTVTAFGIICTFMLASLASITTLVEAKNQKDGKFAKTLDEYHSTIKCMLNIAEETLPELNDFMTCCGFWAMHDFIIHKVDDECEPQNLQQVKHLAGLMVPHVREQCLGYEHGSFTCRMLVIMPITFAILFVVIILSICVCSCVSFYKWIAVRRKYLRVVNLNTAASNNQMTKNNLSKGKFLPDEP